MSMTFLPHLCFDKKPAFMLMLTLSMLAMTEGQGYAKTAPSNDVTSDIMLDNDTGNGFSSSPDKQPSGTMQQHLATCGVNYYHQQPPQIVDSKLASDTLPLCFDGFAVMYSGVSKTALWSAELLTKERISNSSEMERVNSFHPEPRLPTNIRAELADYTRSGYDRGHLSPNGDMATTSQQYDSFSLANIVPQNPMHNRNLWKDIETRTRALAMQYGQVYVVTGVAFKGDSIKQLNGRIFIPSHMFKAIYVPSIGQAGAYYSPNDDTQRAEVISLNELANRTGINIMPAVPTNVKSVAMPLPMDNKAPTSNTPISQTTPATTHSKKSSPSHESSNALTGLLMAILHWLASLFK